MTYFPALTLLMNARSGTRPKTARASNVLGVRSLFRLPSTLKTTVHWAYNRVSALRALDSKELGCNLCAGLIEQAFLRDMEAHNARVVRPWNFKSFMLAPEDTEFPVHVTLQHAKEQATRVVRAKYLVGCDGGRSSVRHFLVDHHGFEFKGEWVDTLWGAIDAGKPSTVLHSVCCLVDSTKVVKSDFPDLRKIAAIHSKDHGGLILLGHEHILGCLTRYMIAMYIFPRENSASGRPMVRLYTQINIKDGRKDTNPAHLTRDSVTAKDIMAADQRVRANLGALFHYD